MGREFEGLRGVLARRSRATSGGESIGGAGPHLQRLGVGADRRTDVNRLSLQMCVNSASSPSVSPPHVNLGSLAPSRPRSLVRPRCRESRDDVEGQVVAGLVLMQRSTSLRHGLHVTRRAVRRRILVRQRLVRADQFTELVTRVLLAFLRHRRPSFLTLLNVCHSSI